MIAAAARLVVFVILAAWLQVTCAKAVTIEPGDLVTAQFDNFGSIWRVDPQTRWRELLSRWPAIGSGPRMSRLTSIAPLPDGDFLVADAGFGSGIYLIDRETGDRQFISGIGGPEQQGYPASRGDGLIDTPFTVLLDGQGRIVVVNAGGGYSTSGFISIVDAVTGDRTLVSGLGVGNGLELLHPTGAVFDDTGRLLVADSVGRAIISVDLDTGTRSLVTGATRGDGPMLGDVHDVLVLPDGDIVASDINYDVGPPFLSSLFRVDPLTGDRTVILSGSEIEDNFARISLGIDGEILASTASNEGSIFSIDPSTGHKRRVGTGLFWGDIYQNPIPEAPSAALLAVGATGCTSLVLRLRRQGRCRLLSRRLGTASEATIPARCGARQRPNRAQLSA